MAFKSAMLLVILLVAAINAQSVTINTPTGTNSIYLGVWSPWYTISANDNTQTPFTLTFTNTNVDPNAPANSVEISSSSFTFNPTTRTQSFRVRSNNAQIANFEITSNMNADLGLVYTNNVQFSFENRTISIDAFGTTKVGIPSEPRLIYINVPSTSDLNFVPSFENNTISFSPNPIVIKAGALTGEFTWTSSIYGSNNWHVTFDVQGTESNLYFRQDIDGIYNFDVEQKAWEVSSPNPNILIGSSGVNVNSFYVSASNNVTGSVTVTPQAADLTFTPASVQLNGNTKHAIFNVTAVNPNFVNGRTVTIFTSGDITQYPYTQDSFFVTTTVTVPKRNIYVKRATSDLTINNITYISIAIPAPVNSGLTLTLSAANLVFNTTADSHKDNAWANQVSVTFSGATTSIVVAALAQFIGPDQVRFAVSGADMDLYNAVNNLNYNVIQANIIAPTDYSALQNFWVGVESEPIPIRASISPINWVSVRLFAPNVKFNPEVIRFRNGSEQQYFTITPMYTNNNVNSVYTTTVEYLLDGPNYDHYFEIAPAQITVQQREFQTAWSAHTTTDDGTTATLGLHKTYKVWASVNYIAKGEQVTLTPVSPYFSFSPKVLNFHGSTNRILFDAQVTGLPASGSNVVIDYIVGGKDGGLYTPLGTDTVSVDLRPLEIVGAVVSTDERVSEKKAVLLTDRYYVDSNGDEQFYSFSPSKLATYHVYSFMIRSFVLPDHDLTITPVSPHVKFSPSKITLKPSNAVKRIDYTAHTSNYINEGVTYVFNSTGVYAEANFTVEALAAGLHKVRFDLSGSDKDYYSRIPSQDMLFKLVMRPDSEPFKAVLSSSSSLFPSFVVVAVIAAFALVL